MSNNSMVEFYEMLGFEEIEIEDGLIVLGLEVTPEGHYALVTDDEGTMPKTSSQGIIFAYYTADDVFLWSAGFKNSNVFKKIWDSTQAITAKLDAIMEYRKENEAF